MVAKTIRNVLGDPGSWPNSSWGPGDIVPNFKRATLESISEAPGGVTVAFLSNGKQYVSTLAVGDEREAVLRRLRDAKGQRLQYVLDWEV